MNALDRAAADRLAKLCGMFGSDHDGERATAAAMADKLLRDRGLTWPDLLSSPAPAPAVPVAPPSGPAMNWRAVVAACRQRRDLLNDWEQRFLASLAGRRHPTGKQLNVLAKIAAKVSAR